MTRHEEHKSPENLCVMCKHCTVPRALCTSNIFSRVAQERFATHVCVHFETIIHHSRASCLTRTHCGLTSHHFLFLSRFPLYFNLLTVTNNHLIDGQKDGLVGWSYKVLLRVMSPTSLLRRLISHSKRGETCRDLLTLTEIEQRSKKWKGDAFRK